MNKQIAVAEGLFSGDPDSPLLLGSRCDACDNVTFPQQSSCPKCAEQVMEPIELPSSGVLWSWTIQEFEPKEPYRAPDGGFRPYGVGYVDLGEVIVESRLTENDPNRLRIGMPMRLVLVEAFRNPSGESAMTFAFEPAAES